jgi:superfamily I DNA/RNA helicase
MRVRKYLSDKNISAHELIILCEYLYLNNLGLNSKMSDTLIKLFDETLNSEKYKNWYLLKFTSISYEKIEFENARELIQHLSAYSSTVIDNNLSLRIINALRYLISKNRFSPENSESILRIIDSETPLLEKIKNLKTLKLAKNRKIPNRLKMKYKKEEEIEPEEDHKHTPSACDDFSWGGLSGEEAYIAYWNTQ